ncbi:MAG: hypothetical protein JW822_11160 [Spirochaetales bacterium]|nr:hypothetical protein [Spirochaetales bacterium]
MVKAELIKNSPLRILEKSTHGGVGKGNIGIIAARKGVGKTACLVHIATDQLFQGKHVIHVSFSSNTSHIITWYEDIFQEIARRRDLSDAMQVHDEIIKNRVIMNFNQEGISIRQIIKSLEAMIHQGAFAADCIIFDGYSFSKGNPQDFKDLKEFAEGSKLELWFSASLSDDETDFDADGVPGVISLFMEQIAILILLNSHEGNIKLELKKDHDLTPIQNMHLTLDPKILLISRG